LTGAQELFAMASLVLGDSAAQAQEERASMALEEERLC
jgi:hypothetical protein